MTMRTNGVLTPPVNITQSITTPRQGVVIDVATHPMYVNTKQRGVFRMASLGDVHLGHPRTPTAIIVHNLDTYCTNDAVLSQLDMLVITGDLFDRLLSNNDPQVYVIQRWATMLMWRCAKYDVLLRIVEGTPSHDREQSQFFVEQATNAQIPVDLHYASVLSIEFIERFGIHLLYVPDKWRPHTDETYVEVLQLLRQNNLEQVDFAIMHGAFEYQLPSIVSEPTHDSAAYLKLVRYFIFIGHVHNATQYDRILAAGSFDRDGHGNEEPKGYYNVQIYAPDNYRITFVENQGAKRYLTIDCTGMDSKTAAVLISRTIISLPQGSALRVRCAPGDAIAGDIETYIKEYPHYEWTLAKTRDERERAEEMERLMQMDVEEFIPIDPSTLPSLLQDEIQRLVSDDAQHKRCVDRLTEALMELTHERDRS